MKITDKTTAYEVKNMQLQGILEKEDYHKAIEIYDRKIKFLNDCLKDCSKFDVDSLIQNKQEFIVLKNLIYLQLMMRENQIFYSKYLKNKESEHIPVKIISIDSFRDEINVDYGFGSDIWILSYCIYAFENGDYSFNKFS